MTKTILTSKPKTDLSKYKSVLFREENTLVFKSGDFEKRWSSFFFIPHTYAVCEIFRGKYEIESFDDYCKRTLGKNSSSLDSFMNLSNQHNHNYNLKVEYDYQYKKLMYVGFSKKYGIGAANFKKIFNHIMREIWEIKPYFSQFCYLHKNRIEGRRKIGIFYIDEENVNLLHKNISLLNETKKNNQENLNPFVFYSGMKTSELKKYFTKSLWQKICDNSFSRNKLIATKSKNELIQFSNLNKQTKNNLINKANENGNYMSRTAPECIEYYNNFASTILNLSHIEMNKASIALSNCCSPKEFKKEYNHNDESLYRIIFDTIARLCGNNKKYDLNWSKEQWISKHKEISNTIENTPF